MPSPSATEQLQRALEDVRAEIRAAGARRTAAIAELQAANEDLADLAIRTKGTLPVAEIAELADLKTRKAVYDLIGWRSGSKPNRH